VNVQALLAGALAKLELAPWAANYGATGYVDQGALKNITVETEVTSSPIDADNVLAELGEYDTKLGAVLKATLMQHDLRKRALVLGQPTSDVVVTPGSAGVPPKAVLGFGARGTKQYLTAKLTITGLSLAPGYAEDPTAVYDTIILTFPRVTAKVKATEGFAKNKVWEFPFELTAYWDSTVTTVGHEIYRITQTGPTP
jgi:hypothetical protein